MTIKELSYYIYYGLTALVLRQHKPLVAGVALTDECNLECRHCVVANQGHGPYAFTRLMEIFQLVYQRGARILYLQGGEIFTWSDGELTIHDVIRAARAMGFFRVAVVTNGTFPIELDADAVWVSLDGLEKEHDAIRGQGSFQKTLHHIRNSHHPNLRVNITVNRDNQEVVEDFIRTMSREPRIRGISVNLHTPYPGVEDLALSRSQRQEVLHKVMDLKRQGLRILNSMAGLKALATGRYQRPVFMIQLMEQDQVFECCWGRQYPEVCEQCGYGIIPELAAIQSLRPSALLGALGLFG